MDTPRDPAFRRIRRRRRWLIGAATGLATASLAVGVDRSLPEAPSLTTEALWIRTVQRGPMPRQIRGAGILVAESGTPAGLKAEIRVAEAQTHGLVVGHPAVVRTPTGVASGHIARIMAPHGGTVGLDIALDSPLPRGTRRNVSVAATIDVEPLNDVLFMQSPSSGQERTAISLFKVVSPDEVERTSVRVGRRSARFVEVEGGLAEGDRVVMSDMAQYEGFEKLRLH